MYFADSLGSINVEEDIVSPAELTNFFDRLYYSNFVVNEDSGN